jgi:hypothetical protein
MLSVCKWAENCFCTCGGSATYLLLCPPTTAINPRRHWGMLPARAPALSTITCLLLTPAVRLLLGAALLRAAAPVVQAGGHGSRQGGHLPRFHHLTLQRLDPHRLLWWLVKQG